jgi:hypothetical protein
MDNPTNQPPKTTSRVTMWIVLIVVVIALGIGAYFLLNRGGTNTNNANTAISNATTNKNVNSTGSTNSVANSNTNTATNANIDTSGWKTYTNQTYNYSFKYPANSNINEEQNQITVYDANRTDEIVLVIIKGGIQDVKNSIDTIQNLHAGDITETTLNGNKAYIIEVTHTTVKNTFKDIAIDLSNGYSARITPFELDPTTGFPATSEDQGIISAIINSFRLL